MPTINRLSAVDSLQDGDQLPVYDQSNGDARKASISVLLSLIFGTDRTLEGVLTADGIIISSNPPATSSSIGTAGTITWDDTYLYMCVADNTWKRVPFASW